MRKVGKPNSFEKGMKLDMDPLIQDKSSYRYAKNIRLTSFRGKNVAVQPYDSDKLALYLDTGDVTVAETSSISDIANWDIVTQAIEEAEGSIVTWGDLFEFMNGDVTSYPVDIPGLFSSGNPGDSYVPGANEVFDIAYNFVEGFLAAYNGNFAETVENANGDIFPALVEGNIFSQFIDEISSQNLPVTMSLTGIGDSNSDGIGLSFNVILTDSSGVETVVGPINIPPGSEISVYSDDPIYFETIIANGITSATNDITAMVGDAGAGSVNWSFQSSTPIVSIDIQAVGEIIWTSNVAENAMWSAFASSF